MCAPLLRHLFLILIWSPSRWKWNDSLHSSEWWLLRLWREYRTSLLILLQLHLKKNNLDIVPGCFCIFYRDCNWLRTRIYLVCKLRKQNLKNVNGEEKKPHRSCALCNPLCVIPENKFLGKALKVLKYIDLISEIWLGWIWRAGNCGVSRRKILLREQGTQVAHHSVLQRYPNPNLPFRT